MNVMDTGVGAIPGKPNIIMHIYTKGLGNMLGHMHTNRFNEQMTLYNSLLDKLALGTFFPTFYLVQLLLDHD